jgi:hypothetical protein
LDVENNFSVEKSEITEATNAAGLITESHQSHLFGALGKFAGVLRISKLFLNLFDPVFSVQFS